MENNDKLKNSLVSLLTQTFFYVFTLGYGILNNIEFIQCFLVGWVIGGVLGEITNIIIVKRAGFTYNDYLNLKKYENFEKYCNWHVWPQSIINLIVLGLFCYSGHYFATAAMFFNLMLDNCIYSGKPEQSIDISEE